MLNDIKVDIVVCKVVHLKCRIMHDRESVFKHYLNVQLYVVQCQSRKGIPIVVFLATRYLISM